jgi:hypothetical protein
MVTHHQPLPDTPSARAIISLLVILGGLPSSVTTAQEGFQFAGLSLRTTIQEAQRRYPRSQVSGRHVYVSDAESHDHIHAIDLPDMTSNPRLTVFFEQTTAKGNAYPSCDALATPLRVRFGAPANIQEFDEERSRNRRLRWRNAREEMSLLCFRQGRQPFSAAELTITVRTAD